MLIVLEMFKLDRSVSNDWVKVAQRELMVMISIQGFVRGINEDR